jgi:hypothetical protein
VQAIAAVAVHNLMQLEQSCMLIQEISDRRWCLCAVVTVILAAGVHAQPKSVFSESLPGLEGELYTNREYTLQES